MKPSPNIGLLLLLLGGCSVILDFDDCKVDGDCAQFGPGLLCDEGRCVSKGGSGGGPPGVSTYGDLLEFPCSRIYGVGAGDDYDPNTILLGTLLPATGDLGAYGPPIDRAVELAVEEINNEGGVFGRRLAVISCDTATDPEVAKQAAKLLADTAGVPAVVGAAASSITIETFTQVAKDRGMLMISPASTSPALTDLPDDDLLWRAAPSDAVQGQAIAAYLLEQTDAGLRNVAIVYRNDAYGSGLQNAIIDNFCSEADGDKKFDCTDETRFVTRAYGEDNHLDDQSSILLDMEADKYVPDIIVLIGFLADGIGFINLASEAGLERFVLTDGTKSKELIGSVPDSVLCQSIGTNPASPKGKTFQKFELKYSSKWSEAPGAFNANSYDATYMLAYAIASLDVGTQELSGALISTGLKRLSDKSGLLVPAGATDWNKTIQELKNNPEVGIDFDGASGALDMNDKGEPASGTIEGFYFDLEKGDIGSFGIIFEEGKYTSPKYADDAAVPPGCTPPVEETR